MSVGAETGALVEREHDLARLGERLRAAAEGSPAFVFLQDPAGIGKTRLVGAARGLAREHAFGVLSARGSELERDFAYGVVRQLLEPPIVDASPSELAELLAGAAGAAGSLFGVAPAHGPERGLVDPSFAVLHGLYWLCVNLARRGPLLLTVDDVHWADQASLRFLHFLVRRLEGLPLAVVVAARPADSDEGAILLAGLEADPAAEVVRPAALSSRGVALLARAGFGVEPDPAFTAACHAVTGGVPFLVVELVRMLSADGVEPTRDAAQQVASAAPHSIAQSVVLRLHGLTGEAVALARATAILAESDLRLAARLVGIDPGRAAEAADALAAVGILESGRPLRFVHPIVRTAIEAEVPSAKRARLHAGAAALYAAEDAPLERIAAHLLLATPTGDDRVVSVLRSAARSAVASGAPDSAVAYLRRALAEPPTDEERPDALLELGFAESYAGDPQAKPHLESALEAAEPSSAQLSTALALGRMLQIEGRNADALGVFERTLARLGEVDRQRALTLEGAMLGAAQLDAETSAEAAVRISRLRRILEKERGVPASIFGMLAVSAATENEPHETVADLARRALGRAPKLLPEAIDRPPFFYHACAALALAEHYDEAARHLEQALADARRLGSLPHVLALSCYIGLLHLRLGEVSEAEADARTALEAGARLPGFHAVLAVAVLRYPLDERFPTILHSAWLRASRGRLRLAQRRPADAVGDLLAAGELFARVHAPLTDLGAALRRSSRRTESREVLRQALDLAVRSGALAIAARARTELVAAGGRPRRLLLRGVDALTPSELRVARMATAGLSNREIAQQLFVTTRTVEGHLTHAYRKLEIASREELAAALGSSDPLSGAA